MRLHTATQAQDLGDETWMPDDFGRDLVLHLDNLRMSSVKLYCAKVVFHYSSL